MLKIGQPCRKDKYQGLKQYYVETLHAVHYEDALDETVEQRLDFDIQDGAQFLEGPSDHEAVGDQGSGDSAGGSEKGSDSDSNSDSDDEPPPTTGKNKRRNSNRRDASEEKYSEDRFCWRDVGINECFSPQ